MIFESLSSIFIILTPLSPKSLRLIYKRLEKDENIYSFLAVDILDRSRIAPWVTLLSVPRLGTSNNQSEPSERKRLTSDFKLIINILQYIFTDFLSHLIRMTNHIWAGHQDIHNHKDIFNFCDNSRVTVTWLIWTFRQLIRVMRILDLTDKKTMTKATTGYCSINKTTSIFCDPHEYPRQIEDTEQPLQSLGMLSSISHYRFFWDRADGLGFSGLLARDSEAKRQHTLQCTRFHTTQIGCSIWWWTSL